MSSVGEEFFLLSFASGAIVEAEETFAESLRAFKFGDIASDISGGFLYL